MTTVRVVPRLSLAFGGDSLHWCDAWIHLLHHIAVKERVKWGYIGKYLSRIRKFAQVIALQEGFEA